MNLSRIAIFITGFSSLLIGGMMCVSGYHQAQENAQITLNQNLKTQAQIFADQFYTVIEAAKSSSSDLTNLPYVTHHGVVKLDQGLPSEMIALDSLNHSSATSVMNNIAFEERVLAALKKQLTVNDLKLGRAVIGTYDMTDMGSKEGIFVATNVAQTVTPAVENRVHVILIDPALAMGAFSKLVNNEHAFLINQNGKILAHTLNAYVGTDLKKIESLKETIENLFIGAQTGGVTRYKNVDGSHEQIAFVRAGVLPFAIAVEQNALAPVLSAAWFKEQISSGSARKNAGVMAILFATALLFMSFMSLWLSRKNRQELRAQMQSQLSSQPPAPHFNWTRPVENTIIPEIAMTETVANAAEQFVAAKEQREEAQEQHQNEAQVLTQNAPAFDQNFANTIDQAYTVEAIERELVDVSSKLTESPVLYFRYQRSAQNLSLTAAAGSVKIQNHSLMKVYVRKDIEQQIEKFSDEGKIASIANYAPVAKLMISTLNVAHYEAWAVTADASVNSSGAQMVGVIVVLQAGFKSAEARPVLAKMIREAGNRLSLFGNKKIATTNQNIHP